MGNNHLIVPVLFLLGACIGSFLNVVIFRLPILLERKWRFESSTTLGLHYNKKDRYPEVFNLFFPASTCLLCNMKVPVWANIPILGYGLLMGKCVKCKQKFSIQYLFVELACAIIFALAGYINNDLYIILSEVLFVSIVICLIGIDFKTFLLPDELTLLLLWCGLLVNLHGLIAGSLARAVLGAVSGYLVLWLIYWIFKLITKREGIGYGDFKFLAGILAWVGINCITPILLLASLMGIIYFLIAYFIKKIALNDPVPFGPFLGMAGMVVLLFHKQFIELFPLPL